MTQEEYEKGFVDYMTKNNGNNKEHIADMKADFLSGAKWRMNSVWHDANKKPKHNRMVLVININGSPLICGPVYRGWKDTVRIFGVIKWAYVEDMHD